MNLDSGNRAAIEDSADTRPILIIPYMWIGDFVRGHSLVRLLNQRWPNRPVDLLTTTLCAPLIDYIGALALPDRAVLPTEWPVPQLRVPLEEISRFRQARGLGQATAVALASGSVGPAKRWTYYAQAARMLAERGFDVWVVGGPGEKALAAEIVATGGKHVRDLTGTDLRDGILAMAAAQMAVSNDSGVMHVAAAR